MITQHGSTLGNAVALLNTRWIALQTGLALLVFALFVAWLRVPDASALDVVVSGLLGFVVLAVAGVGEAWLLLRLSAHPLKAGRAALGGLAVLAGIGLGLGWSALLAHFAVNDSLWAGYLNSRLPHGLRNLFSYPHISECLVWLWALLRWVGYGVIAAFVAASVVGLSLPSAAKNALRSVAYWSVLLAGSALLDMGNGWLANWTPGHGLAVETVSLVLRMSALVVVDGVIVSTILAVLVASIRRYDTPAGTPDESQPRMATIP
jgi:hypothetical protein